MKSLIENRYTEKDIRIWLDAHGYFGNTAKVHELELHAIQRPGWLQVFRFRLEAKSRSGNWVTLFGAVRDDERSKEISIQTFEQFSQQQRLLSEWSEGLIRRKAKSTDEVLSVPKAGLAVLAFVLFMFGIAVLVDALS